MAYIGNDLQVAYQSYQIIDDISGSFNGSTTSFALLVGGVAPVPFPINEQQCLISVGGVIQEPDPTGTNGFRFSGGNIVFSSAPGSGEDFFGVILAGADYVNVGVNYPSGSVSAPSITFDTDLDTGIYNPAANELGLVTNGTNHLNIDSGGQVEISSAGSAASPALVFNTDIDTGIYSPGANQIAFATNGTEAARIDSSGNLQFDSGYGSVATAYGCRAWVNFDGTGTVAIRESGNVSSITDLGTAQYTVNFASAMPDANYCTQITYGIGSSRGMMAYINQATYTTTAVRLDAISHDALRQDSDVVCVSIFR